MAARQLVVENVENVHGTKLVVDNAGESIVIDNTAGRWLL